MMEISRRPSRYEPAWLSCRSRKARIAGGRSGSWIAIGPRLARRAVSRGSLCCCSPRSAQTSSTASCCRVASSFEAVRDGSATAAWSSARRLISSASPSPRAASISTASLRLLAAASLIADRSTLCGPVDEPAASSMDAGRRPIATASGPSACQSATGCALAPRGFEALEALSLVACGASSVAVRFEGSAVRVRARPGAAAL
jgi:hypothetical protein